jgi:transcriptional regulator with XRE-family HTH domain
MYMPQSYDHRITGRVIRRLRLERGMSQEILSGLAALSRSHLAEIESGKDNANVETLWRITGGLDIRLSDLLRRVEEEIERRV